MQTRIFAGLFFTTLLIVVAVGAQSTLEREKPVWTMEFIKVKPEMFGFTLGYLDDHWMRVREDAKRQGTVLSYHRIVEKDSSEGERNIVLLTEYKNQAAYDDSHKKLVAPPGFPVSRFVLGGLPKTEDLYEAVSTRVFRDYSDASAAARTSH